MHDLSCHYIALAITKYLSHRAIDCLSIYNLCQIDNEAELTEQSSYCVSTGNYTIKYIIYYIIYILYIIYLE